MILENLIPIPYSDLEARMMIQPTANQFSDLDLVFKLNQQEEYFLFEKNGSWNEENIAIPEFDVRELFNENTWFKENNELR